ncbi:MAG: MFS transporter [Chloroflexi bacterium]|nr:MFS transporter [Chloroflexota bacterium]
MGLFFPLWITQDLGGDDATVGFTLSVAMVIMLLVAPLVGAFSDHAPRRMPFLAVGTFTCIVATLLLGVGGLFASLMLFALAVIAINVATIFYNAMLAEVSTEANRGTIGGLGVAVGYLGAIAAVVLGLTLVADQGYEMGFRAVGLLYLLIAVPLLVLLKERPRPVQALTLVKRVSGTFGQLRTTLSGIHRFPGLLRFLMARFWYVWSLNTASTFAILYGTETIGFTAREVEVVLLLGIVVAIPSGLVWGRVVDRIGPGRVLSFALSGWVAVLLAAITIAHFELPTYLWWPIGFASGVVVAGTWVADRPYMMALSPPEYLGELFGLHNMTGRLSVIAGPFFWGLISVTLGFGQTAAVLTLAVCAVIALVLMLGAGRKAASVARDLRLSGEEATTT